MKNKVEDLYNLINEYKDYTFNDAVKDRLDGILNSYITELSHVVTRLSMHKVKVYKEFSK